MILSSITYNPRLPRYSWREMYHSELFLLADYFVHAHLGDAISYQIEHVFEKKL